MKNLAFILGFVPWLIFSELYGPTKSQMLTASISALISTLVLNYPQLRKCFILPITSVIYFIILALNSWFDVCNWGDAHPAALINLAIASIVWMSIIIGKPFTLQYAKEQVSANYWKSSLFLKINRELSLMWAVVLTISALPSILIPQVQYSHSWFWNYGFSSICFLSAVYLNRRMRDWIIGRNFWQNVAKLPVVDSPYLKGGYKPVLDEVELDDLPIIGVIPSGLNGSYLRNGPNPYFPQYTYTYPIDGDGMVHRLVLENGKASYKNVFVKTAGLLAEVKAGKALFGGIKLPIPADPKYVGKLENKNTASIHVTRYQDKYLALYETNTAYLLDQNLNTLGEWQPNGIQNFKVNAHFRQDPQTGQRFMFVYDIDGEYLQFYEFNSNWQLIKTVPIAKANLTMIHDFVITKNYIIVFDAPAIFNIKNNSGDEPFFAYHDALGLNIILIKREDYSYTTIGDIPSFWVYHFVNAYEEDNQIIIDFVHHNRLELNPSLLTSNGFPRLYRGKIDLSSLSYQHECLFNEYAIEFPNYNLTKTGDKYRYAYFAAKKPGVTGGFNAIIKYDFKENSPFIVDYGPDIEVDEATFIPSGGAEDEGYLVFYIYHKSEDRSDFLILDAVNPTIEHGRVKLPIRVPHGLHGSWVSNS